jgi:transposase
MDASQKEPGRDRRKSYSFAGPGGSLVVRADDELALDLAMLIEGETSGRPLEDVLARFGRSRTAYYEKLRRFREEGASGLVPKPPGPHGPWRRSHEVIRFIVTARLRDPTRSPEAIARDLAALGQEVSVRSVERTLQQFGLTRARARRSSRAGAGASAADAAPPGAALSDAAPSPFAASPGDAAPPPVVAHTLPAPLDVTPRVVSEADLDAVRLPGATANAS